ncbi:MAG: DinB family protein [Spirochaetales bacterium]|nr:DinB family protein [Spirochaetales bacterium]
MDKMIEIYLNQMEQNRDIFKGLLSDIAADRMTEIFYEGMWNVKEHVKHLLMTQSLLKKRIELFIEEEHPRITPYYPEKDTIDSTGNVSDYLTGFCAIRDEQLALIRTAEEPVFTRTGIHPGYVKYSFPILLRHIILHDQFHLYRIENAGLARPETIERL